MASCSRDTRKRGRGGTVEVFYFDTEQSLNKKKGKGGKEKRENIKALRFKENCSLAGEATGQTLFSVGWGENKHKEDQTPSIKTLYVSRLKQFSRGGK